MPDLPIGRNDAVAASAKGRTEIPEKVRAMVAEVTAAPKLRPRREWRIFDTQDNREAYGAFTTRRSAERFLAKERRIDKATGMTYTDDLRIETRMVIETPWKPIDG